MLLPHQPYTLRSVDGTTHHHCRVCGYRPASEFHPSLIRQKRRQCRDCRNSANYRGRMSTEAARVLFNFKRHVRRVAPELARRWTLADVEKLLDQVAKNEADKASSGAATKWSLVPRSNATWATVTPGTACLVTESEARSLAHLKRSVLTDRN